ncbi:hypothetical protein [Polluticoccus soli]|uniref:hypothetical protein n=1 Tax=Polluticoccus soli TaxID=3034150 RepID=UPI0023E32498|nr:hypothetical protein [Flavipsychrobacter sp. JY13-12]
MYTFTNKFRSLLLAIAVLTSLVAFQSCEKKDPCGESCVNGYCADGDCVCQTGYSGKWCATYVGGGSSSSSGGSTSSSGGSSSGSSTSSSGGSSSSSSSSSGGSSYKLTFWSDFQGNPISVYVDGSYAGQITQYYSSTPSCGATGCVTKTYTSPRTVSYSAEDGTQTWNSSVTVSASCNTMCLQD